MKRTNYLAIFGFLFLASTLFSQEQKEHCSDVVYLKGGTILRGKISEYTLGGDLVMLTWSGCQMRMPAVNVKRIVQKCKDDKKERGAFTQLPYSFDEKDWYHATRFGVLPGDSGLGLGMQHSSGYQFNRLLGAGIGIGIENFDPGDSDLATFPIFAELRGYLLPKSITPFYAIGLGYGISKRESSAVAIDGPVERWRGGWMAQGQIGYRIGNHATIHFGIRVQHKTRTWENFFWSNDSGIDRILHKRLDIGLGILL